MLPKLNLGPAALVTAAFIGPGTIITASHAGANFGFTLIWALLFAVLAAIVLQEMSARLGLATGMGLAENLERRFERKIPKRAVQIIVLLAIVVGNAAYQGGNIAGANIGLTIISENLFASSSGSLQVLTISLIAGSLLWFGGYPMVEKTLLALVALMSLCFVAVAWLVVDDWSVVAAALLPPQLPDGAGLSVIALIGTTVVPYNLFLHSRSVSEKWQGQDAIRSARQDILISIPVGGLISIAVMCVAASLFFKTLTPLHSAADIANGLTPVAGRSGQLMVAIGLAAAGFSSAITAPLAAAYTLQGLFPHPSGSAQQVIFRAAWIAILVIGSGLALSGYRPTTIILLAQFTNGLLLPLACIFLLWAMNSQAMGRMRNNWWQNLAGTLVLLITLILGGKSLWQVLH